MEFLCTKCLNLVETDPCPVCGGSGADLREPRPEDECYLCTQVNRYGAMLAGALDRYFLSGNGRKEARKNDG